MQAQQAYDQYHIPNNLREHMLRVASLAKIIFDNWQGPAVDQNSIITCALFHDIAKPVTFDINKQRQYVASDKEFAQVKKTIEEMSAKYGTNEHAAAIKIFQEMGSSEEAIRLINNLEWIYLPRLLKEDDTSSLVLTYCDMRIGPHGILPITERFADLKARAPFPDIDKISQLTPILEDKIQSLTSINLNSITNEQINSEEKS